LERNFANYGKKFLVYLANVEEPNKLIWGKPEEKKCNSLDEGTIIGIIILYEQ
jgi:hypothetical protein